MVDRPTDDHSVQSPPARRSLGRRQFLALAGATGAIGVLGAALGPRAWDALFGGTASGGTPGSPDGPKLVLVTLYGGNDGLNTVVPYESSAYAAARGLLAVDPSSVLPLGEGFGLHAGMPGFKRLWDAGQLAVVHGVGFTDPNYSHFESMDIWQSGVPDTPVSTGWIGRWLDATASSPLRAIGIGPTLPTVLSGEHVQGAAIPAGPITLPGDPAEQARYATLATPGPRSPGLESQSAAADAVLLELNERIGSILDRSAGDDPLHLSGPGSPSSAGAAAGSLAISNGGGGQGAANVLATQLSVVANLILAGATADVYSVDLGGFDTHSDQLDVQSALLGQLDTAVTAFVGALRRNRRGERTVVLVYTEFGRRVAANASAGTDHGWANVSFVAGPTVKGGFFGEPPSLTKLSEGNTVYTTDFRSVYATLLAGVLGVDPKSLLHGSFPTLPIV